MSDNPSISMSQASGDRSSVSAILVSYNTADLTCRAIDSLKAELDLTRDEIIVVDNASSDNTSARLEAEHPDVRFILNPTNSGFGAANNIGMKAARNDLFLLINTDAFIEPGAVVTLCGKLDSEPRIGVVGPKLLNQDRTLQRSCFAFPSATQAWREALAMHYLFPGIERWAHDSERDVDFVSGACMIVRREVFESVGGFDERFFMYSEESDWQRRITDAGWSVRFTPEAEVVHLGGGSHKGGGIHPEFFISVDKYQLKHSGWLGLVIFRAAMVTGLLIRLPYRLLQALRGDLSALKRSMQLLQRQTLTWRGLNVHGARK